VTPRPWNPFGRRDAAPLPPPLAAALADLDRLTAERPELLAAGQTLARVLRVAFLAPTSDVPPHADPDLLLAAWRAGVPAFRAGDEPPTLDADDLRRRARSVLDALRPENPDADHFLEALRSGAADLHAWALDGLSDRTAELDAKAASLGIDPGLARSVLRLALLPTLSRLTDRLSPVRPEGLWTAGHCPHCGGPPTLAESRGLEQRRVLRCGLCAAAWAGDRLRCPFCGESDHRRLRQLSAEGESDRYRLAVCEACGGRLRVVSTLVELSPPGILVAELAVVHLELGEEAR
jgi:FdhE protein